MPTERDGRRRFASLKIAIGLLALIIVPLAAEVRTVDSAEALFLGGGLFLRLSRHRGLKPTVVHS